MSQTLPYFPTFAQNQLTATLQKSTPTQSNIHNSFTLNNIEDSPPNPLEYKLLPHGHLDLSNKIIKEEHKFRSYNGVIALNLAKNQLSEVEDLPESVENLDLSHNKLAAFPISISHLPQLQILNLSHNRLITLQGIEHCLSLHELYLSNNCLNDSQIRLLTILSELEILDISHNNINDQTSLTMLENLPKLKSLTITANGQTKALFDKSSLILEKLCMDSNDLSTVEFKAHKISLTTLSVCNNRISKLKGLSGLRSLETLICDNNQLTTISSTKHLANLKVVSASANKLESFNVSAHNRLEILDLSSNMVNNLGFLPSCPHLKRLIIANNRISKVPDCSLYFINLLTLDLSHNNLSSLVALERFPSLQELHLAYNSIFHLNSLVTELKKLKSLRQLDLRQNKFNAEFDLAKLVPQVVQESSLQAIEKLFMPDREQVFVEFVKYRGNLISDLSRSLIVLDCIKVTEYEMLLAQKYLEKSISSANSSVRRYNPYENQENLLDPEIPTSIETTNTRYSILNNENRKSPLTIRQQNYHNENNNEITKSPIREHSGQKIQPPDMMMNKIKHRHGYNNLERNVQTKTPERTEHKNKNKPVVAVKQETVSKTSVSTSSVSNTEESQTKYFMLKNFEKVVVNRIQLHDEAARAKQLHKFHNVEEAIVYPNIVKEEVPSYHSKVAEGKRHAHGNKSSKLKYQSLVIDSEDSEKQMEPSRNSIESKMRESTKEKPSSSNKGSRRSIHNKENSAKVEEVEKVTERQSQGVRSEGEKRRGSLVQDSKRTDSTTSSEKLENMKLEREIEWKKVTESIDVSKQLVAELEKVDKERKRRLRDMQILKKLHKDDKAVDDSVPIKQKAAKIELTENFSTPLRTTESSLVNEITHDLRKSYHKNLKEIKHKLKDVLKRKNLNNMSMIELERGEKLHRRTKEDSYEKKRDNASFEIPRSRHSESGSRSVMDLRKGYGYNDKARRLYDEEKAAYLKRKQRSHSVIVGRKEDSRDRGRSGSRDNRGEYYYRGSYDGRPSREGSFNRDMEDERYYQKRYRTRYDDVYSSYNRGYDGYRDRDLRRSQSRSQSRSRSRSPFEVLRNHSMDKRRSRSRGSAEGSTFMRDVDDFMIEKMIERLDNDKKMAGNPYYKLYKDTVLQKRREDLRSQSMAYSNKKPDLNNDVNHSFQHIPETDKPPSSPVKSQQSHKKMTNSQIILNKDLYRQASSNRKDQRQELDITNTSQPKAFKTRNKENETSDKPIDRPPSRNSSAATTSLLKKTPNINTDYSISSSSIVAGQSSKDASSKREDSEMKKSAKNELKGLRSGGASQKTNSTSKANLKHNEESMKNQSFSASGKSTSKISMPEPSFPSQDLAIAVFTRNIPNDELFVDCSCIGGILIEFLKELEIDADYKGIWNLLSNIKDYIPRKLTEQSFLDLFMLPQTKDLLAGYNIFMDIDTARFLSSSNNSSSKSKLDTGSDLAYSNHNLSSKNRELGLDIKSTGKKNEYTHLTSLINDGNSNNNNNNLHHGISSSVPISSLLRNEESSGGSMNYNTPLVSGTDKNYIAENHVSNRRGSYTHSLSSCTTNTRKSSIEELYVDNGMVPLKWNEVYERDLAELFLQLTPYSMTPPRPIFGKDSQNTILKEVASTSSENILISAILRKFAFELKRAVKTYNYSQHKKLEKTVEEKIMLRPIQYKFGGMELKGRIKKDFEDFNTIGLKNENSMQFYKPVLLFHSAQLNTLARLVEDQDGFRSIYKENPVELIFSHKTDICFEHYKSFIERFHIKGKKDQDINGSFINEMLRKKPKWRLIISQVYLGNCYIEKELTYKDFTEISEIKVLELLKDGYTSIYFKINETYLVLLAENCIPTYLCEYQFDQAV